jgi:hypothetical protein
MTVKGVRDLDIKQFVFACRISLSTLVCRGTAVAQWLRFCATNRKVAGSIPEDVIEFFR